MRPGRATPNIYVVVPCINIDMVWCKFVDVCCTWIIVVFSLVICKLVASSWNIYNSVLHGRIEEDTGS